MQQLTKFELGDKTFDVEYVESIGIKYGVACDAYRFSGDDSRDLGLIEVAPDNSTPRQLVLNGLRTIEGFMHGSGYLTISDEESGSSTTYLYPSDLSPAEVAVQAGQIMQWRAGQEGLTFYEICEPPYQPGRYKDLPEQAPNS